MALAHNLEIDYRGEWGAPIESGVSPTTGGTQ